MVPDTRFAVLGLLIRKPSHGYELATRFGELLGPGWEINKGQIYDMVGTLQANGLVERIPAPQTGRKEKRYRATAAGERAFAAWVATPSTQGRPQRDTLYLKLALAGPGDAQHLLDSIRAQEQGCLDRLRSCTEDAARTSTSADDWETLARDMIDETITMQLHAELEWLAHMRNRIEQLLRRLPVSSADAPQLPIVRDADDASLRRAS